MSRIIAAVAVAVTAALMTVAPGFTSSKDGRGLDAQYAAGFACGPASGHAIQLSEDGQSVTSLRPGTYWITVNDNCNIHNFVLNDAPVSAGGEVLGDPVTSIPDTPGLQTFKVHLTHGTYRLYCSRHPATMIVDFTVGGVGQTDS